MVTVYGLNSYHNQQITNSLTFKSYRCNIYAEHKKIAKKSYKCNLKKERDVEFE